MKTSDLMGGILFDIQKERERQEILKAQGKFTFTCADPNLSHPEKLAVLAEEFGEAAREVTELVIQKNKGFDVNYNHGIIEVLKFKLRKELIETATVCVAWIESLDIELDNRKDFPAEEQASLSTNLADLTKPTAHWLDDKKVCSKIYEPYKYCELPDGHSGKCGMLP